MCSPLGKKDDEAPPPSLPKATKVAIAHHLIRKTMWKPRQRKTSKPPAALRRRANFCASAPEIEDFCDEAVKLGKRLAVGVVGKHWLLQEATTKQIDILLCTPKEKRPSFAKTIIASMNSALDKNITAMERVSFCPICHEPAPKSNACETCKQPAHLHCGGRLDSPEFHCNHCRNKGMAADSLADLKGANDIDPPPEDMPPGNNPDNTKDSTNMPPPEDRPPGNNPDNTKDTTNNNDSANIEPKRPDDPPSVNPGAFELSIVCNVIKSELMRMHEIESE